jgi:cytochrome c556
MLRSKLFAMGGAAAVALTLTAAPASLTSAATPAEIIAQRQAVMELQGATAIGIVVAMKAGDLSRIAKMAAPLAESARTLPSLFEKGTGPEAGKTGALPAIWEKPGDFKAAAANLESASAKLAEAAKAGDQAAVAAQFKALANACDGCHDNFRAKY